MYARIFWATAVCGIVGGVAGAQTLERRAVFTGGGNPNEGKCTIAVVVDGSADVEIRGDRAILRNLSGQPPQWRVFQCTGPLPNRPANFRFQGVDGRGSQQLIRDPREGGPAVVRIGDPDHGAEGYTFDVFWGGGIPGRGDGPVGPPPGRGPDFDRGPRGRFTTDEAVRVCQDSVRDQAIDRLRGARIDFRRTTIDDNPGRQDWVIGTFEARRGNGRSDIFRFSCSVDFGSGRVRSASFEPARR